MSSHNRKSTGSRKKLIAGISALVIAALAIFLGFQYMSPTASSSNGIKSALTTKKASTYKVSDEEKSYLKNKFDGLTATNPDTIAYVYAPGTKLDEPVVQTTDNSTYLNKTFDGGNVPYLGTVFMDTDNKKDFSDRLTWLFGHARGSKVADSRMFNDVNYYSDQSFFDKHKYVVIETPQRKYYYEALAMVIVPEDTAFYRTSFENDKDFKQQLDIIYDHASVKNKDLKVSASDKYLVLSTCREEDETIRANLYLRQIPDSQMTDFVAKHGKDLEYTPTR